ncbi:ABC transporter substrate-binding protein [Dankookia rubra]|uniref:ABC transporter substrate-binding protein n=1 Tax=Dankookia rubra TaxID=1442381 RepID=A0A4R5QF14_9PROT|nr:ABC transporter substrate-binding protein [Dankookia rubra]TDH61586.1 ABC transporter substrate-binding protein [Dankookia rubra]
MRSIAAAAAIAALTALTGPAVAQTTITISCTDAGMERTLCQEGAEAWAKETGNRVQLISLPLSSNERLAFYQQRLQTGSSDIDVFQIDMVWMNTLATHLIDLSGSIGRGEVAQHFGPMIENNTVNGRLVAMPWFVNAGLLYYRQDLLEKYGRRVPETWQELTETARLVMEGERRAGNKGMWGYAFQGSAYEGLTVNALEWLDSYRAGNIVEPGGSISVNNPRAVEALTTAASWINTIAPPGVLDHNEEKTRELFQSGNAVFMRNWPYAWPLLNAERSAVKGRVGIAVLPKGGPDGKHTGALGGEQLAVSRYSAAPSEAISLVRHLTSRAEQKRRAVVGAFNPTIGELYRDHEVLTANPFFSELYGTFRSAVARPSAAAGVQYSRVSEEFWSTVHAILSGQSNDIGSELGRLEKTLDRIIR